MGILQKLKSLVTPVYETDAAKANPAYMALVSYGDMPQPHMMPRQYRSYSVEGYRVDATAYKCISYIARNGAAIPPKLYTSRKREDIISDHPLLEKLNHPNPEQTGTAYREAVLSYLLIAGNTYQYAIRPTPKKPPEELWALRPDYVQVIVNSQGITGYLYQGNTQDKTTYAPQDVNHVKYWSPNDDLYGLSPMEIAAILIDQQTAARKWNLALLQNWARLPGAWVVPNPIGKNERDRLEWKLREKFSSYRNAGSPPVLDGGLKWENMAVPPAQMDWLEGLELNAAQIANIYNIPPMVIGDRAATTFDNMKQAEVYSYTEGIFPDLDKVYDAWNMWLVPMYPDLCDRNGNPKAYLYYDKESVEVIQEMIQEQKNAQSKRANAMFMGCQCTLNESRELQGLPALPGGDRLRLGYSLIPVAALQSEEIIAVTNFGISEAPSDGSEMPENGPLPLQPVSSRQNTPEPEAAPSQPHTEAPKKSIDTKKWEDYSVPDRINTLQLLGVTHIQWTCGDHPCPVCAQNEGVIRQLGDLFPSGAVLPQSHPNCQCTVVQVFDLAEPLIPLEEAQYQGYREFQRRYR